MRLRLFVLVAVCILIDVLVARTVKQYDVAITHEKGTKHKQIAAISSQDLKPGKPPAAQKSKHGPTAC